MRFLLRSLITTCILLSTLKAQDIHFSQFNGSLLNINPAFTGFFNGDYRVGAIYRTQWRAVPVPYNTVSFSGETRIQPDLERRDMMGVGVVFNNDRAGDTRYHTTQLYVHGSYIYSAKEDSSLLISGGLNLGYCSVGFDYARMTFDNQYDGLNYYANSPTGEQFQWTNDNFFDYNVGAAAQYILDRKHRFVFGTALHHLTSPHITYQGNDVSKLDRKSSTYAQFVTPINQKVDLVAELLYNRQGKYNELVPHASFKYYTNKQINQSISAGFSARAVDAFILRGGYTYKNLQAGVSYDINFSKFTAATNARGAFEIYVIHVFFKKYQSVLKKKPCPVFM
jgi:type IX secretion system PorP/SprF family membrane protein